MQDARERSRRRIRRRKEERAKAETVVNVHDARIEEAGKLTKSVRQSPLPKADP